jgi:hypothetical protein
MKLMQPLLDLEESCTNTITHTCIHAYIHKQMKLMQPLLDLKESCSNTNTYIHTQMKLMQPLLDLEAASRAGSIPALEYNQKRKIIVEELRERGVMDPRKPLIGHNPKRGPDGSKIIILTGMFVRMVFLCMYTLNKA